MSKKELAGATTSERAEWASRVKSLRQTLGLKQTELAKLAGVSRQTVSNMERGYVPQENSLRAVLEVLGFETDESQFDQQTDLWLTMLGTLIETIPQNERAPIADAAVRVVAEGVKRTGTSNVIPLRKDVPTEDEALELGAVAKTQVIDVPDEQGK